MIEVRDLHKRFGTQHVLRGVNLQVEKGESVVIIGRSGCGKSVLLKHLIGLMKVEEGDVLVDGLSLKGLNERQLLRVRRNFGMLFQTAALFDSLTVAENVGFALRRSRQFNEQEIARQVGEALELVDLPGTEAKKPAQLSGGMRKRVGLARAIVYRPQIILYDEPTSGLDPIMTDSIDRLIVRICDRMKVTSIAVTHDMQSASRIGQRILMLEEGSIYLSATPDELFRSKDPVVQRFVQGISEEHEHSFQP